MPWAINLRIGIEYNYIGDGLGGKNDKRWILTLMTIIYNEVHNSRLTAASALPSSGRMLAALPELADSSTGHNNNIITIILVR